MFVFFMFNQPPSKTKQEEDGVSFKSLESPLWNPFLQMESVMSYNPTKSSRVCVLNVIRLKAKFISSLVSYV